MEQAGSGVRTAAELRAYLGREGAKAELVRTGAEMPTVEQAAAALGVEPDRVIKSVVFQVKKAPEKLVVAIATGTRRIATPKVAAALGLGPLRLAPPAAVLSCTGYAVGGVPPVGHRNRLPVVVDRGVFAHAEIFGGGGDEAHMLKLAPEEILRLSGGLCADILA